MDRSNSPAVSRSAIDDPQAFAKFDTKQLQRVFKEDNQRFRDINLDKLRARERAMLAELQTLQVKKDRIKRLKSQQNSIAERLRLEIKKHSWQQEQSLVEEKEVQKALDEIERSKRIALEKFKAEEMKRIGDERKEMEQSREVKERDLSGFPEPANGLMN